MCVWCVCVCLSVCVCVYECVSVCDVYECVCVSVCVLCVCVSVCVCVEERGGRGKLELLPHELVSSLSKGGRIAYIFGELTEDVTCLILTIREQMLTNSFHTYV